MPLHLLNLSVAVAGVAHGALPDAHLEAVYRALGRHALTPRPTMTLNLLPGEQVCTQAGTLFQTSQGPLKLHVLPNRWELCGGRVVIEFQSGEPTPRVQVALPADPNPEEAVAAHLALTEAGRLSGLLPLHAAVLARHGHDGREGRAVAILGESGAGKSTATLRLVERGWALVAEDSAWLDPATGRIVGADEGLRVHRASLERFAPHWLARELPRDAHGKWRVPIPPAGPAVLQAVYALASPEGANASADDGPLPPVQAVPLWWQATGLPVLSAARQQVSHGINRVIRQFNVERTDRDELIGRLSATS